MKLVLDLINNRQMSSEFMNRSKKTVILAGLLVAATYATPSGVTGAELQVPAPAAKSTPAFLTGKIAAVEKTSRTLTVQVKGTELIIKVTPKVQITKKGKPVSFDSLAPGQVVQINFVELTDGTIEVARLAVLPATPDQKADAEKVAAQPLQPLSGNPNPANIGGPVVSPNQ